MPDTLSPSDFILQLQLRHERAWNRVIPKCAVDAKVTGMGLAYLHPTKGWKYVSGKRFALYV